MLTAPRGAPLRTARRACLAKPGSMLTSLARPSAEGANRARKRRCQAPLHALRAQLASRRRAPARRHALCAIKGRQVQAAASPVAEARPFVNRARLARGRSLRTRAGVCLAPRMLCPPQPPPAAARATRGGCRTRHAKLASPAVRAPSPITVLDAVRRVPAASSVRSGTAAPVSRAV